MKLWTLTEVEPKQRLQWAHEVPGEMDIPNFNVVLTYTLGDFHFLWECLKVVYSIFWGNPSEFGSLCNMREYVNRKQVDKNVKVFNVGDEFLMNVFNAHLQARICSILKIGSPTDNIQHLVSADWLKTTAETIVEQSINPITSSDPVYMKCRCFLHLAFLYVDLRNAIRWENGPQIIRHWKLWLPRFLATGCKNYAGEAVNLITHLTADFPKHISYILQYTIVPLIQLVNLDMGNLLIN